MAVFFDSEYRQFDGYFFYTTEDLTKGGKPEEPPMSAQGKKNFLEAITEGKGFIGSHCASDTFHSPGNRTLKSDTLDPYIEMIGGEFIRHGRQQVAKMRIVDKNFQAWRTLKRISASTKNGIPSRILLPTCTLSWYKKPREWWMQITNGHLTPRHGLVSMARAESSIHPWDHREDVWTNPIFESFSSRHQLGSWPSRCGSTIQHSRGHTSGKHTSKAVIETPEIASRMMVCFHHSRQVKIDWYSDSYLKAVSLGRILECTSSGSPARATF